MKHTVIFNAPKDNLELDADSIAIQPPGLFVAVKDQQVVAMFPIGSIAGIHTPDGLSQVVIPTGGVAL